MLAFGFCKYKQPESTFCGLRLHDIQIVEMKLLVTVDAKAKAQLDEWKAKKKASNGVCNIFSSLGVLVQCEYFIMQ